MVSVDKTDGKKDWGSLDSNDAMRDAIRGMAHVVGYMLCQLGGLGLNEEGESDLISTLIVDISQQPEEVVPERAKRFVMCMVSAVEHTLREEALRRKAEKSNGG